MHDYHNLRSVFERHLSHSFNPPEFLDEEDGLNVHMYLGHLLHEMVSPSVTAALRRRVADLVEDLQVNGDEGCRNLVHVSFFENMDRLSPSAVGDIRALFSPRMREAMDAAFKLLGYDFE